MSPLSTSFRRWKAILDVSSKWAASRASLNVQSPSARRRRTSRRIGFASESSVAGASREAIDARTASTPVAVIFAGSYATASGPFPSSSERTASKSATISASRCRARSSSTADRTTAARCPGLGKVLDRFADPHGVRGFEVDVGDPLHFRRGRGGRDQKDLIPSFGRERPRILDGVPQGGPLRPQGELLAHQFEDPMDLSRLHGLPEVVERPLMQGPDRLFHRRTIRQHDDRHTGPAVACIGQ